nr:TonB-dependent receptor [Bacteroidota bacterium]
MRKILILLFILLVVLNSTRAESPLSKIAIKGQITDVSDGEPLLGVNVFIEHTTLGAATNQNGEYLLWSVPKGNIHIVASMMGYKMVHKEIEANQEKEYIINFELEQTMFEMGSVVVTGTGTPHIFEDMPVRTEVITRVAIEQKNSMNLADALSFQTGVRVENNCSNCNFSQVRILGMEGKYSQILVDGDPVVSSLAGVYGLEHFPEEMISQIEIVKG